MVTLAKESNGKYSVTFMLYGKIYKTTFKHKCEAKKEYSKKVKFFK